MSFICPICRRTSHNPIDERERFCAVCGYVDDPWTTAARQNAPGATKGQASAHRSAAASIEATAPATQAAGASEP